MKEKDIRPDKLQRENQKLRQKDIRRILAFRKKFVKVSCPACGGKTEKPIFKKDGFNFVQCRRCGTIFINSRPSFSLLADFYGNSSCIKYWNNKIFPISENVRRRQIFAPRATRVVALCKKYSVDNSLLVDVGAGFGTFCEEIKKKKFFKKVLAIEPSADLAATCRRKGIETIEKPIEKTVLKRASVITSFELIEHLFNPKEFISACAKSLAKKGLFIITTPNVKGFDFSVLGKKADNFGGPNHLNYFHPQSLKILLESCGLEMVEITTPGKLDAELVRKKILSGESDAKEFPFLKQILIDRWEKLGGKFQNFLAENNLSSHMWIVARKK